MKRKEYRHEIMKKIREQEDILSLASSPSLLEYATGFKKGLEWALKKMEELEKEE